MFLNMNQWEIWLNLGVFFFFFQIHNAKNFFALFEREY